MKQLCALIFVFAVSFTYAGKDKNDPSKFDKVYYKSTEIVMGDVVIQLKDIVANDEMMKFRMYVANNGNDYFLIKPGEIAINIEGKEYKNLEKKMVIGPHEDAARTIDFKGNVFRKAQLNLTINGFNHVIAPTTAVDFPSFHLPVSQNEYSAGSFKIAHIDNEKKTDLVSVKLNVFYNGPNVGIVAPANAVIKFPKTAAEFANQRSNTRPMLIENGSSETFKTVWREIPVGNGDAQFANLEILWKETFKEGKGSILPTKELVLEWDQGLTNGKK